MAKNGHYVTQFVVNPTRGSNILVIVTDKKIITNVEIKPPLANSHHNMVQFNLMTEGNCTQKNYTKYNFRTAKWDKYYQ